MIEIRGLTKSFHGSTVLDQIDLTIQRGDVVAVIGSSGAGKSTLLRSINLLETPDAGTIKIDELRVDTARKTKKEVLELRKSTAMVFQQFNLFRQKTALENVMEGLIVVKKIAKEEARKIAESQLAKVGLSERVHHYPKQLSGGQQQRVAIARALAMQPKILLFDEPTSALDPELVGEVLDTIKQAAEEGNTMLIVSHEMNFVRKVATRVLFLDQGLIVEDGTPQEVFSHPKSERTKQFLSNYYRDQEPEFAI
ncbi:amino acid ABC transporter ATP-binding protein [Paenibacillus motobuensis]|uniref:amino acid ABC transporter ATP-binding protein n=1 Tax=Paenibacillus TaxID=44249 RepID=UPI00204258EB|nr:MULTISPECIES: amino acid ABC transporter ATP-binding protein [Paenibacillus]MCM3039968.1 amino acid ABC transporter ATP-binding protein [Paenibacillus lutimineralis]MCM3647072.1 amino acid ABC transporter ATP-binding protein [Paenibacillus motobuensis]